VKPKPKAKGQSEAKTKAKSQKPSEIQQITRKNFPGLKEKTLKQTSQKNIPSNLKQLEGQT
jgi:hypothetical protein